MNAKQIYNFVIVHSHFECKPPTFSDFSVTVETVEVYDNVNKYLTRPETELPLPSCYTSSNCKLSATGLNDHILLCTSLPWFTSSCQHQHFQIDSLLSLLCLCCFALLQRNFLGNQISFTTAIAVVVIL